MHLRALKIEKYVSTSHTVTIWVKYNRGTQGSIHCSENCAGYHERGISVPLLTFAVYRPHAFNPLP